MYGVYGNTEGENNGLWLRKITVPRPNTGILFFDSSYNIQFTGGTFPAKQRHQNKSRRKQQPVPRVAGANTQPRPPAYCADCVDVLAAGHTNNAQHTWRHNKKKSGVRRGNLATGTHQLMVFTAELVPTHILPSFVLHTLLAKKISKNHTPYATCDARVSMLQATLNSGTPSPHARHTSRAASSTLSPKTII